MGVAADAAEGKQPVLIRSDGIVSRIEVGGHPLQGMTEWLSLEIDARTRLPVLTLRLLVTRSLDADMQARVLLDEDTTEALKAMGWTPPGGEM